MSKIVIMESLGISEEELAARKKPFEEKGHVFADYPKTTDIPTLIRQAKDADAMIIANMPMPGEVIRACGRLKFIDVAFTGVDHVGLDAAKEKGIAVSNASGYSNEAVSELVLGMVLNILRNMSAVEARCRAGQTKDGLIGSELKGKTVGVQTGSSAQEILEASDLYSSITVTPLEDNITLLNQMELGFSDAVFLDSVVANYLITSNSKDYVILPGNLEAEEYAIGFRKEDQALRDKVQETLSAMKADGKLGEISTNWFGSDVTTVK